MNKQDSILQTSVTGINFETPLILASGFITETPEFFLKANSYGCSAMVTRSLKKNPRGEVTAPRYFVASGGDYMLNAEWGNEYPWTMWYDKWVQEINDSGSPLILSLSGRNINECVELISIFNHLQIAAYEINISCPHSGFVHGNMNIDFSHLRELVTSVVKISKNPIWVKLGYSSFVNEMAKEAENCGADAIVATNSIGPGLNINLESTKPSLGIHGGRGGLSGKAIFPLALECVWTLCQTVKIPVIACGGVYNANSALQMILAGAKAVQAYTAPALNGPEIFSDIIVGMKKYCHSHSTTINNLIGLSQQWSHTEHSFTANPPYIVVDDCIGCKKCLRACAFNAISMTRSASGKCNVAKINTNCISCNACIGVCPKLCIQDQHIKPGDYDG